MRTLDEITDDRQFYWAKMQAARAERQAHLRSHQGALRDTVGCDGIGAPGSLCQQLEAAAEYWQHRYSTAPRRHHADRAE